MLVKFKKISVIFCLLISGMAQAAFNFGDYNAGRARMVYESNALKTADSTMLAKGFINDFDVALTVFYDYNCSASRQLISQVIPDVLGKYQNYKFKIIYRPMDYGFGSGAFLEKFLAFKYKYPNQLDFFKFIDPKVTPTIEGFKNAQPTYGYAVEVSQLTQEELKKAQKEIVDNKADFERLPFPAALTLNYKSAIPVVVISIPSANKKYIYYVGSEKSSFEAAVASIFKFTPTPGMRCAAPRTDIASAAHNLKNGENTEPTLKKCFDACRGSLDCVVYRNESKYNDRITCYAVKNCKFEAGTSDNQQFEYVYTTVFSGLESNFTVSGKTDKLTVKGMFCLNAPQMFSAVGEHATEIDMTLKKCFDYCNSHASCFYVHRRDVMAEGKIYCEAIKQNDCNMEVGSFGDSPDKNYYDYIYKKLE